MSVVAAGTIERGNVPRQVARGWVALALQVWGDYAPPRWQAQAACRDHDPRHWDSDDTAHTAQVICASCPVRDHCDADAQRWETATPHQPVQPNGLRGGRRAGQRATQYLQDRYGIGNERTPR